jgi:hypothetical protein
MKIETLECIGTKVDYKQDLDMCNTDSDMKYSLLI